MNIYIYTHIYQTHISETKILYASEETSNSEWVERGLQPSQTLIRGPKRLRHYVKNQGYDQSREHL